MPRRIAPSRPGRASGGAPQTYEGTYSGYGSTRADSIGQPISQTAFSSSQYTKAFNTKANTTPALVKVEGS